MNKRKAESIKQQIDYELIVSIQKKQTHVLTLSDNGNGIPQKIVDNFFSTIL